MVSSSIRPSTLLAASLFCVVATLASLAQAQDAPNQGLTQRPGIVTGDDVYVRSGNSTNHYTICKLDAGTRVTIVGEQGDWLEILPPAGTYSLISGDYIDSPDGRAGTVNGDNVRVRAGSLLNDSKYTVQGMLSRGDKVTILGNNPDGFLRIAPPSVATVWISRQFVQAAEGGSADQPVAGNNQPVSAGGALASPTAVDAKEVKSQTVASSSSSSTWRARLDAIDAAAREEMAKAPGERDIAGLMAKYRPVAEQTDDTYANQYAAARLLELDNMLALKTAINSVRTLDEKAEASRREYLEGRASIPPPEIEPIRTGLEIQGELRVSALYPPGSSVRRYRLIDPTAERDRTLAYVEIPADLPLKMEDFIGRYVGVRASQRRLQQGGVNPVPIYVASEIVLLQPRVDMGGASGQNTP